jgi:hypothetical protein
MLGRPEIDVPVFMTVWAGSWLIWSVCIERMMQISSAILAVYGRMSAISWPDWPCLRKVNCGARHFSSCP